MSQATWQLLGVIGAALLSLSGVIITVRNSARQTRTNVTQQIIDQLQEERNTIEQRLTRIEESAKLEIRRAQEKIEELNRKVNEQGREAMIMRDFVQELRNHIRLGLGPPPPDWPESLRG